MNRFAAITAVALAAGAGLGFVPDVRPAAVGAASAADLLGSYKVKLRGEGWAARAPGGKDATGASKTSEARIAGNATLLVRARDPGVNDGLVTVEIVLDAVTQAGLLGGATPNKPAFVGTAAPSGDWLAMIDAGQPNYVNAVNLRFDGSGRRVSGSWMAVFPAGESDLATQKFATGVTVTLNGRRSLRQAPARLR